MNVAAGVRPNLKPFRDYDEHDVINLFAHVSGNVNKGTLVKVHQVSGNTNVYESGTTPARPHVTYQGIPAYTPEGVYAYRNEVYWKVQTTTSGNTPLGITLYDVKTVGRFGEKDVLFDPEYQKENDVVPSGLAVPILTKGLVKTNGFVGTPGPGSGARVSNTVGGEIDVAAYDRSAATHVGKFLTGADVDGYAILKIEL